MSYPEQTPQDMERETLGNIALLGGAIQQKAMVMDVDGVISNYYALCRQMGRLEVVMCIYKQTPEKQ